MARAQTAEQRAGAGVHIRETAETAAALYAGFLNADIPVPNARGVVRFTEGQAFELVRTLLYEALKDGDLL
jgi:hypothetical protein